MHKRKALEGYVHCALVEQLWQLHVMVLSQSGVQMKHLLQVWL